MKMGYLFMEYIPGRTLNSLDLDELEHRNIVPQVVNIIEHLQKIPVESKIPGPLAGSQPHGYLWGDYGAGTSFQSIDDLNAWLNRRLELRKLSIDVSPYPLVLCHMDLCRRNMILDDNGVICLVDWGHAALLPRFFEYATITCLNPYDGPYYEKTLLQTVEKVLCVTEEEKCLIDQLHMARGLSLRYRFKDSSEEPPKPAEVDFATAPPPPGYNSWSEVPPPKEYK